MTATDVRYEKLLAQARAATASKTRGCLANMPELLAVPTPAPEESDLDGDTAKKKRQSKDELCFEIAQKFDESTGGQIACFTPPETARSTPVFSEMQPNGSYLPMKPEALQDALNAAAGRALSPSEFTLVCWYLASAVLRNRGSATLQTGLQCKNGFVTFDPPAFTPGKSDKPCQFYIPREFFPEWDSLPDPLSLEIIQGWKPWGQDVLFLLEIIARVLLTQPAGDFLACFGPGGDGKSTFFEFIEALIGAWNVLRTSAYEFSKDRRNRGVASLNGVLLALLDDAGEDTFQIMGTFLKEVATAPSLAGARLYEDPISFLSTVFLAILGNRLPKRNDHSRGFYDRDHVSIWPNRIRNTSGDVSDIEKLWARNEHEMDLIFSYAVNLAWNFTRTGRWHHHNDPQESERLSDALASTEARFLWERLDGEMDAFLAWDDIEDTYRDWWPDPDHRPRFDRDRFLEALSATWQGTAQRKQIHGERVRGVIGLRIVPKTRNSEYSEKPSIDAVFPNSQNRTENKVARKRHGLTGILSRNGNEDKDNEENIGKFAGNSVAFSGHSQPSPETEEEQAMRELDEVLGKQGTP